MENTSNYSIQDNGYSSNADLVEPAIATAARLFVWRNRTLFVSTIPIEQGEFTVSSDQLIICLRGEIKVRGDDGVVRGGRTFLLRAGTAIKKSQVDSSGVVAAACYLNPVGQDYPILKQSMTGEVAEALTGHQQEDQFIELMRYISSNQLDAKDAYEKLDRLIVPEHMRGQIIQEYDPRVVKVLHRLKETVRDNHSIAELASEVFLSESRLVKLFKIQIGIPITKYRLRYRVYVGVVHLSLGRSVTEAALAAGFASTAHFSKCYSAMMGLQPSSGFLRPPYIDVILADEIAKAAMENQ